MLQQIVLSIITKELSKAVYSIFHLQLEIEYGLATLYSHIKFGTFLFRWYELSDNLNIKVSSVKKPL